MNIVKFLRAPILKKIRERLPPKVVKKNVLPFTPGLSLCNLYFLFNKGKDTSAIPQPSVHEFIYVLPIFFCFHKCFHNFHQSKILLTNKFFSLTRVSSYFSFHDARDFEVKYLTLFKVK